MDYLWLAIALAVGFVLGWILSRRRATDEMARFEGRVEELQGRLIRAQRANEALLADAVSGQDSGAMPPPHGGLAQPSGALRPPVHHPEDHAGDNGATSVAPAGELDDEDYEYVEVDELTEIRGIGAVLQDKLYDLGIYSYEQIAALTPEEIARLDRELRLRGRIERDNWIGQARRILDQGEPQPPQSSLL